MQTDYLRVTSGSIATGAYADTLEAQTAFEVRHRRELETAREMIRQAAEREMKANNAEGAELLLRALYENYRIGARSNWRGFFADYMIALEWNRDAERRFWLPRQRILEGKHGLISEIEDFMLDDDALFLGISLPPGTGKTTLIMFLLTYITGKWPNSTNMYLSYADTVVRKMYDSVLSVLWDRAKEYNYVDIWERGQKRRKLSFSAEAYTLSYRPSGDFPTLGLVTVGGQVTGRTRANKFMITDDLIKNREQAMSLTQTQKLWDDYTMVVTSRQIGNCKQIMLGTRWCPRDPLSRMEKKHVGDRRYRFVALPVKDEFGNSNFEYDGDVDKYTARKIEDIENTLDPIDFGALYMQNPIDKAGILLKSDELKYYENLPEGAPDAVYIGCDVAFGGADRLCMPVAYVYGERVYIEDVVFMSGDPKITKPKVVDAIIRNNVQIGEFESNNGGEIYAENIIDMLKKLKHACHITTRYAPTKAAKEVRIEAEAMFIREWYFKARSVQNREYREYFDEMTSFTLTGANPHDDAADGTAILSKLLRGRKKEIKFVDVRSFM